MVATVTVTVNLLLGAASSPNSFKSLIYLKNIQFTTDLSLKNSETKTFYFLRPSIDHLANPIEQQICGLFYKTSDLIISIRRIMCETSSHDKSTHESNKT